MRWLSGSGGQFRSSQWFALFAITRGTAALIAPLLLLVQDLSGQDQVLGLIALGYGAATIVLLARFDALQTSRLFWTADVVAVLMLVVAYGEWRSPFYLLALTALILPGTALPPRRAVAFGLAFVVAYFGAALVVGVDWNAVASTARLESFVTHLFVPLMITVALTFGAELLRRLERERERSERLALEAERKRIAWELHDSAKQRIHAAHLVLSAAPSNGEGARDSAVSLALRELAAATTEMESSLRDLREPLLEGDSLGRALRQWADRLQAGSAVEIDVLGDAPTLPALVAVHAYRIGCEALLNAVRHAQAVHADVVVNVSEERLHLVVTDDGKGLPAEIRPGANGLRSMHKRAEAIGGHLTITPGIHGRGTMVALHAPVEAGDEAPA